MDASTLTQPYVMLLDESDLTSTNINTLLEDSNANNKGKLVGVIVLNTTTDGSTLVSPDAAAPQGADTPSSSLTGGYSYEWNGNGGGLLNVDLYGIPMAYVDSSKVSSYFTTVSQEDDKVDSIVAEFDYYMGPDNVDSATCLAWKDTDDDEWRHKCQPLGGNSIWATAGSPEQKDEERRLEDEDSNGQRPVVLLGTSIDATSMFHDIAPGANSAASNILALLMAAKLLGTNINDETLDGLTNRIAFSFFQGESYGFLGSRSFFRDVAFPGFECNESRIVPTLAKNNGSDTSSFGCLYPLRPSLEFQKLGDIAGMLVVDQVGVLSTDQTLYVHNDGDDDGSTGAFMSKILQASGTESFSVSAADLGDDANVLPPTPLTSLVQLSEGSVGGAVLAGYDNAYANNALYNSHLDSTQYRNINMEAIAAAATLLARTALATAYYDGEMDTDEAVEYAANLIPELSTEDENFVELAECLFRDGSCDMLKKYALSEQQRTTDDTGTNLGSQTPLGTPPNYYVSVYDINNGQPFVDIAGTRYGAYTDEDYGKDASSYFSMRPSVLESSIRAMLDDFLGRGSASSSDNQGEADDDLVSCKQSTSACSDVSYCSKEGDFAVCSGSNVCVCSRSQYHIAVDEAIEAAANNITGRFVVKDDDEGITPMYTEPYWSATTGVRVYRDTGNRAGNIVLGAGIITAATCVITTLLFKQKMKKEKLY